MESNVMQCNHCKEAPVKWKWLANEGEYLVLKKEKKKKKKKKEKKKGSH